MEKHERGCTANPNRVCGLCALAGEAQKPTAQLVEYLLENGLEALQRYVENCPACTMAATRAANKNLSGEEKYWFEYKDAYKSWWQEYNEANPIRYY